MNPLQEYPRVRRALYLIQWAVSGVQAVLSAIFAFVYGASDLEDWPRWFLGTLAVLPVAWAYLGLTAQTNVSTPTTVLDEGEAVEVDEGDLDGH